VQEQTDRVPVDAEQPCAFLLIRGMDHRRTGVPESGSLGGIRISF
jgi:hypothetical protein